MPPDIQLDYCMSRKYHLTIVLLILIWLIPLAGTVLLPKVEPVIASPLYVGWVIAYFAGLAGLDGHINAEGMRVLARLIANYTRANDLFLWTPGAASCLET